MLIFSFIPFLFGLCLHFLKWHKSVKLNSQVRVGVVKKMGRESHFSQQQVICTGQFQFFLDVKEIFQFVFLGILYYGPSV